MVPSGSAPTMGLRRPRRKTLRAGLGARAQQGVETASTLSYQSAARGTNLTCEIAFFSPISCLCTAHPFLHYLEARNAQACAARIPLVPRLLRCHMPKVESSTTPTATSWRLGIG